MNVTRRLVRQRAKKHAKFDECEVSRVRFFYYEFGLLVPNCQRISRAMTLFIVDGCVKVLSS